MRPQRESEKGSQSGNLTADLSRRAIALSDSGGGLSIMATSEDGYTKTRSWKAHDYEAWTTSWHSSDPNILFSGEFGHVAAWKHSLIIRQEEMTVI